MKRYLTITVIPPLLACRHACASSCAAPITVFWLFGVVSVLFGLLGGPTAGTGISWATVALGLTVWGIAAAWTALTTRGVAADRCQPLWSPREQTVDAGLTETDPFDETNKAH